jgi:uncharacterized protein YciI
MLNKKNHTGYKKVLAGILYITILLIVQSQDAAGQQTVTLGKYWFVMYRNGENRRIDSAARKKLDQEHIAFIINLRKTGNIITGGAFTDGGAWNGFEIYHADTKEEVIKITDRDPLVLAGIFSYEIHPWVTLKGTVTFD